MHILHFLLVLGSTAWAATAESPLHKRAECGPGIGSCPPGKCCSEAGWCGNSKAHCGGSACQIDFSDFCDTFFPPPGPSTDDIPRPKIGNVPYGEIITQCVEPGLIALTFDDGPFNYTSQILDILDEYEVKATFFIAGNNKGKGRIDDGNTPWPGILARIHDSGHHIASHTWTHRDLNKVNSTIRRTEMTFNERAFRNIFGWIPTYMRPPYLECAEATGCHGLMDTLGYHIINSNIDTKDYLYDSPDLISTARQRFTGSIAADPSQASYIVLAHDVHLQTVVNLTPFMIEEARARGYRLVTVGECLGDPSANWYRPASGSIISTRATVSPADGQGCSASSPASPTTTAPAEPPKPSLGSIVSPDQTCGGKTGYTCLGSKHGDCCSWYGFCDSREEYCGTGCDDRFGTCLPKSSGLAGTTNGLCGEVFQASCGNYGDKTCCSKYGYCGNTSSHCGAGCQSAFGKCD
ncbi:hypothetical protein F5X68DRAFT_141922 [Plectosphaerella plurivora]|uniref:Chitin deacetylase n=1 Tax=Plectosphaerella plurivora TaxID=936078 RepID=A0A9P8V3D6_9PEZI|nr:hypothetical protein F5X68DRAFT_141922 [Plectosphaerella plurivora]